MAGSLVERIEDSVRKRRNETMELFRDIVLINSHSANPEGINRVGELAVSKMPSQLEHRIHSDEEGVNHHIFTSDSSGPGHVLLVGHLDTVFPIDSPFQYFEELPTL